MYAVRVQGKKFLRSVHWNLHATPLRKGQCAAGWCQGGAHRSRGVARTAGRSVVKNEWLYLAAKGHRRARFEVDNNKEYWLVP